MSQSLTEEKINELMREVWTGADPASNRVLVSLTTVKKIAAVNEFGDRLRWWRRAFYWVFRAKARRDLRRFVAARVPEEPSPPPPLSGLNTFLGITPELAAEQYEREVRRNR